MTRLNRICWTLLYITMSVSGCSQDNTFHTVSGSVTYDGKPVPVGEVQFMPDSTKGNRGPSVMASIKDGQYKTRKGKGIVGGPYVLMVTGYQAAPDSADPTAPGYGAQLFERTKQYFEFPKGDCEHNIVIEKH